MSDETRSGSWPQWLPLRSALRGSSPYGAPQIKDVAVSYTHLTLPTIYSV